MTLLDHYSGTLQYVLERRKSTGEHQLHQVHVRVEMNIIEGVKLKKHMKKPYEIIQGHGILLLVRTTSVIPPFYHNFVSTLFSIYPYEMSDARDRGP